MKVQSRFGTAQYLNNYYFDDISSINGLPYGYIKTLWKDGYFKNGQFHSQLNYNVVPLPSLQHNLSVWENGTFWNGQWNGGNILGGNWQNGIWVCWYFWLNYPHYKCYSTHSKIWL